MHLHRARIGFDDGGKVLAWDHVIVGQSVTAGSVFEEFQVKNGVDATATEGMREPYALPMRLTVHHPKLNRAGVVVAQRGLHPHRLRDGDLARRDRPRDEAGPGRLPDAALRREAIRTTAPRCNWRWTRAATARRPCRRARLGRGGARFLLVRRRLCGRSLGGARTVRPVLHRVTAGVHCNLVVNPRTVEAQVQGAAVMGLSMCLPAPAITFKDGVVQQSNFGDFTVARHHRHAGVRRPHRAERRSAHGHGRARPATTGAGVRQRDRAADRQAAAASCRST